MSWMFSNQKVSAKLFPLQEQNGHISLVHRSTTPAEELLRPRERLSVKTRRKQPVSILI